ncbi:hypothetical protein B0T25DRAFT_540997 [Lasiosphaeria hispida]|uniref:Uncharacterized protein n=1 Tax=Lasiosphaeria hispida TaxID=260671 RepID=A0AAJ0HNJ1_9PEZI|nr:hypothetical protein B0T25DRAFT_540997 [Lasiosphaeria hispida]
MSDRESLTSNDSIVSKPADHVDDGFPSEELRRIYRMASPPYAFPTPNSDDEERKRALLQTIQYKLPPPHGVEYTWPKLNEEVERLAASIHHFLRPWKMLRPDTRDSLLQLAGEKNTELFYTSRHVSPYLIQAWLWHTLDENLFSNPDKWATPTWKVFGGLLSLFSSRAGTLHGCLCWETKPSAKANPMVCLEEGEYHHWRTLTLRMMHGQLGYSEKHSSSERLANLIMRRLADLMDTTEAGLPQGYFEQRVGDLAHVAVVVDLCILRERRHSMIAWHLPGMPNAASMRGYIHRESPALQNCGGTWGLEGEPIDFVVCPGIFQSGEESGIRYDQGRWVAPILAVINQFPNGVPDESDEEENVPPGTKRYRRDATGRLVSS